jgi:hypothetical protein
MALYHEYMIYEYLMHFGSYDYFIIINYLNNYLYAIFLMDGLFEPIMSYFLMEIIMIFIIFLLFILFFISSLKMIYII